MTPPALSSTIPRTPSGDISATKWRAVVNVGQICQRNVVTIWPSEDLRTAARLMREKHIGFLVVVELNAQGELTPTGVLTDRDIVVAVVAQDADPQELKVGDVMTRNPKTVLTEDCLADALSQMQSIGVRRLPVLGARAQLVGVLSLDDALTTMAEELSRAAGAIGRARSREASLRP
jgi:CBS domain-containing protein